MPPDLLVNKLLAPLARALLPLFVIVVVITAFGAIYRLVLRPKLKGWAGETLLHAYLRRKLPSGEYHVSRNVMLPSGDGTTEIDHIVVSRYGVFVIETKTYKGWIYGDKDQAQWTQVLFRRKSRFQNPLRQNYKHTRTLADLTGIPHECIHSVIAFSGECTFKTPMPDNVVKFRYVPEVILRFRTPIIKDEQVADIAAVIGQWADSVDKHQRAHHVRNLRRNHAPVKDTADAPACPLCGTPMITRTNRRDDSRFWGCSHYPRCRGMRQCG